MNSVSASRLFVLVSLTVGLCAARADRNLVITWDPSADSDVTQYNLYYGEVGGEATQKLTVIGTKGTISPLVAGKKYFAYATAVAGEGLESPPSESVVYTAAAGPQLVPVADQSIEAGKTLTLQLRATDQSLPSGQLAFSLVSGPSGATVSSAGTFTWTPTSADAPKTFVVSVRVEEKATPALGDTQSFAVAVVPAFIPVTDKPNTAPVFLSVGGQPWNGGALSSRQVLNNGGFESGLSDWNPAGNVIQKANVSGEPTEGVATAKFNSGQGAANGVLSQTFPTKPGLTYELVFDAGRLAYNLDEQRLLVTVEGGGQLVSQSITLTGPADGSCKWSTKRYTFVANAASTTVQFKDASTATHNIDLLLDNVQVLEKSQAPVSFSVMAGNNLGALLIAADADIPANSLTYSLVNGPTGATVSPAGMFSWTPLQAQARAVHELTVRVTDDGDPALADTRTFAVTVEPAPNSAPALPKPGAQTAFVNRPFTLELAANDPDGVANLLTYKIVSGPLGASIDPAFGQFRWTPTAAQAGMAAVVEVEVQDNGTPPLSDAITFVVVVSKPNTAPVLGSIQNPMIRQGESLLLAFTATDTDNPTQLTYALRSGPAGSSLDPSTGMFQWTPDRSLAPGVYPLTIEVTDDGVPQLSDSKTFVVLVTGVNSPPSLTPVGTQNATEGQTLVVNLVANDPEASSQSLTFKLISGPHGASLSQNGVFSWTPTEEDGPGTKEVTVEVSDNGSPILSDRTTFTIVIAESNASPVLARISDQRVSPGQMLMLGLRATDSDLPKNRLTYQLISGPSGASLNSNSGVFSWRLPKSASTEIHRVTISVTDDGQPRLSDTITFDVVVAGKGSRDTSDVHPNNPSTLRWVAQVDSVRTLVFEHGLEARHKLGEWTHYLEVSEDLIHWKRLGALNGASQWNDPDAHKAKMRFYRIRSHEAGAAPAGEEDEANPAIVN